MSAEFKSATLTAACSGCRVCCNFSANSELWQPRLLPNEKIVISMIPAGDIFFCSSFDREGGICRDYNIRPLDCRIYPALFHTSGEHYYLALDIKNCPWVADNLRQAEESSRKLFQELNLPEIKKILAAHRRIFTPYPEYFVKISGKFDFSLM